MITFVMRTCLYVVAFPPPPFHFPRIVVQPGPLISPPPPPFPQSLSQPLLVAEPPRFHKPVLAANGVSPLSNAALLDSLRLMKGKHVPVWRHPNIIGVQH